MNIDKYFNMLFFVIEIFLYASLITKFLFYKFLKRKTFTSSGVCYICSLIFFLFYGFTGIYPILYGDPFEIVYPLKSFLFITALVYLQMYFYKMSKSFTFKSITTIAKKNCRKYVSAKKNLYIYSVFLFISESLCVPIFSNSNCYIRFYEIIPALCLLVFFIYQIKLSKKVENGFILTPWIVYSLSMIIFLLIRFFIENFVFCNNEILNIIGVFFRTAQLFSLGFIAFAKKNELEAGLK